MAATRALTWNFWTRPTRTNASSCWKRCIPSAKTPSATITKWSSTVSRPTPRLHITLHQVVANQLLAGNPPQTWRTVQRLAGLGYDWHNIMHMIARLVSDDIYQATTEQKPFDLRDYVQRLSELPGDWPPPPAGPS